MISFEQKQYIVRDFGLKKIIERPDIVIMGSPERVEYRVIVEDQQQGCFLLEQVFNKKKDHRLCIAQTLSQLNEQGFKKAIPYCKNVKDKTLFVLFEEKYFQLQPFISAEPLNRPGYVFDDWRGEVMADILIDLKKASKEIDQHSLDQSFSLIRYVDELFWVIKERHVSLAEKLDKAYRIVQENLKGVYEGLPKDFCHGDYHPNNIIWFQKEAKALIDWEFVGIKTELYDVANMISCLGMEDPESLVSDTVISFIKKLKASQVFSSQSFDVLIDLVIAIRFAWISEWLRKKDEEMLLLELDYFELLIEYRTKIKALWAVE